MPRRWCKLAFVLLPLFLINCASLIKSETCNSKNELVNLHGQIKTALILNECSVLNLTTKTYLNSAIWIINRLNFLNFTTPLHMGLSVFSACNKHDYYESMYKMLKQQDEFLFVNALATNTVPEKVERLEEILDVKFNIIDQYTTSSVEASVKLLQLLELNENITIYADNKQVLHTFFKLTRNELMCVEKGVFFNTNTKIKPFQSNHITSIVIFAKNKNLKHFLNTINYNQVSDYQMIFVPFDSSETHAYPEGSYVIEPMFSQTAHPVKLFNLTPSSLFFDVANPLIRIARNISDFINDNCDETLYKFNCLDNKYLTLKENSKEKLSPEEILSTLKIEEMSDSFGYKIFLVQNLTFPMQEKNSSAIFQSYEHLYTYKIFNKTLRNLELDMDLNADDTNNNSCLNCSSECVNFYFDAIPNTVLISSIFSYYGLRSESWTFAFLTIAVLGVLFCLAVLIFLTIRFCKRDILEGNPFLTILLLFSVMLMYCSVFPFMIKTTRKLQTSLVLIRALATTLVYAFSFSLLLSRSILLATVSKEVGFMSHVSGPVQSFLTLFMFGVQGALSLQLVNHCDDVFTGLFFIYLMSYNIILLTLLLFICPINTRTHRNYKEGKYFTVAIVLIAITWSCWIPGFAVFDEEWKDVTVCSGLILTASILLGAIFIPRTYKMAVAAAKDRLSCNIPSVPANSSIMDVYRASTQPIYDCINIAAINAASIARNNLPPPPPPQPQPQIYSRVHPSYDDDFDFERCITPSQDKVTRF